jgi:NADPH:quinone reductase-like Zn-dependent oxidoreductase
MRGAILQKNGPIDTLALGEIPAPEAGRDEILVRVHAAAVNPADLKVVTGKDGGGFIHAMKFPMAVGYDFSGVVEQVGRRPEVARSATRCSGISPTRGRRGRGALPSSWR